MMLNDVQPGMLLINHQKIPGWFGAILIIANVRGIIRTRSMHLNGKEIYYETYDHASATHQIPDVFAILKL